jgi:UDP-N-acetylglucosamine 2-epimerase
VEAGIRTLTPRYAKSEIRNTKSEKVSGFDIRASGFDPALWRNFLMDRSNWQRGSQEPYPEQFNTRCAEAATGIHLAPVDLDREFLQSEGYAEDRIFVVGNSVVDATEEAMERAKSSTVFEHHEQKRCPDPRLGHKHFEISTSQKFQRKIKKCDNYKKPHYLDNFLLSHLLILFTLTYPSKFR